MANYNAGLIELCNNLQTTQRVPKHRKDHLSLLLEYLENPGYVQQLDSNELKQGTVKWSTLFAALHSIIREETAVRYLEEVRKGKKFGPHQQVFSKSCTALALLAAKANARTPYLACRDTISSCLDAFEQPRLRDILSETYMNILSKSVLCKREYWGKIDIRTWTDLLEASVVLFDESSGKLKTIILSCINLICFHGSRLSGFNAQLEKMLGFASKLIGEAVLELYVLQSEALQLCFTLCHQLKKEFRFTVCKFGEQIMPHLIAMYEESCGDIAKKKNILGQLISEIVSAHHPCGVVAKAPGSYATNWDTWISYLNTIHRCLSDELDSRSGLARVDSNLTTTILLLVDVYKQISALGTPTSPDYSQFDFSPTSAKRRKVLNGIECVLDNIKLSGGDELWPWLCFLERLLLKYPEAVTACEFEMIFVYLVDALPISTAPTSILWSYRCTAAVVHTLEFFIEDLSFPKPYLTKELDKFMNICVSALRNSKKVGTKYLDDAHLLVQALLQCGHCSASAVQSVLDLYLENQVPLDSKVLKTLLVLSHVCAFPETSPVRMKLLQWMIAGKDLDKTEMAKMVANVGSILLCRTRNDASHPYSSFLQRTRKYSDEELYFLESSLDKPPRLKECPSDTAQDYLDSNAVIETLKTPFLLILEERTKDMEMMNDPVVILCHALLLHGFHGVMSGSGDCGKKWEELFKQFSSQLTNVLELQFKNAKADESGLPPGFLEGTVEFFKTIKETPELNEEIRSGEISKYLFRILRHSYKNHDEDEIQEADSSINRDFEQLLLDASKDYALPKTLSEALKSLTYMTYEGHETNYLEDHLLEYCKTEVDLKSAKGFKMAMMVLENLLYKINDERLLNDDILNLVVELLKHWFKYHSEVIRILNFLKDLVPLVFKTADDSKYQKFCKIISRCASPILNTFSAPVIVAFTHVVGAIIKMKFCVLKKDSEGYSWNDEFCKTIWSQSVSTPVYLIFDWLLDFAHEPSKNSLHLSLFLRNPFNEVRMVISKYIPYIYMYDAICDEDESRQEVVFQEVVKSASEIFIIEDNTALVNVAEELEKRSCCALRYLTSITAFSPLYRRKALYAFFELVSNKNISFVLAHKAMMDVEKVLKLSSLTKFLEENLSYILLAWFQGRAPLNRIPYHLLDCKTYEEFLLNYKALIIPLRLEERDKSGLQHISETLSVPLSTLITECYPEIMASMLPKLAETPNSKEILEMYGIVEREIGSENMQLLLGRDLDKVMIAVYERLHDESHFERLCGDLNGAKFPQMTHSSIKFSTVRRICNYLEDRAGTPNLLAYLGKDHPIHLHAMLHSLRSNIQEASTDETRYLYFQQYAALCHSLAEIFQLLGNFGGYLVRGVVHQVLNLMKTNLELHAVTFLLKFLSTILPESSQFVDDLLSFIVPALAAVILRNKDKCELRSLAAGSVLKLLMVDHAQVLPSVDTLDPLPRSISASQFVDPDIENRETLRNMEQSLRECMEHFLKAGARAQDIAFREQGLRHLHQKLCSCTDELHELYLELKSMRNFSEQCASSLLHRLIISLVELATSKCGQVSELALVCLGELGPRDLTTLVLKPQPRYKPPSLPFTLVKLLLPYLVSEKVDLAAASAKTLQTLFKTKEGYSLVMSHSDEQEEIEKLSGIELSYITPFWKKSSKLKKSYSRESDSIKLSASLKNWCPEHEEITHEEWLKTLVVSILECCQESSFFTCLIPIAKSEVDIDEGLLPYLAKMILKFNDHCSPLMSQKVNLFFEKHYEMEQKGEPSTPSIYMNRAAVQSMLSLVNFYRLTELSSSSSVDHLNLNYLHVANAAMYCNAYFTAVLYSELWTDSELCKYTVEEGYSILSPLDNLSEAARGDAEILQSLLWESYEKIGENDAVHGCGNVHVSSAQGRIKFYLQMKNWSQVVNECELLRDDIFNDYLVYALRMSGKYKMASEQSRKHDYECAWRLSNWNLEANESDYSGLLYSAVMNIQTESSQETRDLYVKKARDFVVDNYLSHASLEVANSIYEPFSKLRTLREVETRVPEERALDDFSSFTLDVGRWEDLEPILSVRILLSSPSLRDAISLESAALARKAGAYQIAHRFLQGAELFKDKVRHQAMLEEAKLVWESGCLLRAKYLLKELLTQKKIPRAVHASALITYGTWLAESKSELTKDIMKNHFDKAIALLKDEDRSQKLSAADCLARFADSEYQRLREYKKSDEFARKELHLSRCVEKLKELNIAKSKGETNCDPKYKLTLEGQCRVDKEELLDLDKSLSAYLKLATE